MTCRPYDPRLHCENFDLNLGGFYHNSTNLKFYGYAVTLREDTEEERKKAIKFLSLWKHFLMKEIQYGCPTAHIVQPEEYGTQTIYRPAMKIPASLSQDVLADMPATVALKIAVNYNNSNPDSKDHTGDSQVVH